MNLRGCQMVNEAEKEKEKIKRQTHFQLQTQLISELLVYADGVYGLFFFNLNDLLSEIECKL